jgi:glycolate oxidase FAD binding subunit
MAVIAPTDEAGVAAAVRAAHAEDRALELEGGGSRRGFGRPLQTADTLSLAGLAGIEFYEPGELVIRARAGTPLAELEAALAAAGQMLPFEPPDYRRLLGNDGAVPTVGGLVAANLSGPARIARGALRDSLIGVRFVDGEGEIQRSGGRVMKNVTGLDLVKLSAGAHGTLGVLTEVTFKVLPRPEAQLTLAVPGLDPARAGAAMTGALATPLEVAAAAHLPAALAARSAVPEVAGAGTALTLLRLESFADFIGGRVARLAEHLGADSGTLHLETEASRAVWGEIRDVTLLAEPHERAVWKISTAPTAGTALLESLTDELDGEGYLDWSGGLVWLAVPPHQDDAGSATVREALAALGGHATLVRAPATLRAAIDVFEPPTRQVAALTRRVKDAFDPKRILNPGRMYAGV